MMSIGRQPEQQGTMWVAYDEIPKGMGHAFYDHLQKILCRGGFDDFAEKLCAEYYALMTGRPSIPPGRYFRMLLVGYFEGIDSERGICWRCADSLSLREFLRLDTGQKVPDHSSLCRIRQRLPIETHHEVFSFVLQLVAKKGLIKGKKLGIDASTMEANAALKTIVRRDTGEGYDVMLQRLAKESGIATPTKDDRKRKDKTLSNKDWESPVDGDSRIAKLKDGRTHLAYKPEHVVDLDSGAIVSAKIHQANQGDTSILHKTLADARTKLKAVLGKKAPQYDNPAELAADKGYHSRTALVQLDSAFRSRISEPERKGIAHWRGDSDARRAVYNNRSRLQSAKGKSLQRLRSERVERSFAHCLDRGGMRRAHLRGDENIEKRYIIHVAGFNLGLLMRSLFGVGTPKGWADAPAMLVLTCFEGRLALFILFCQSEASEQAECSAAITIHW
jgi:transposase